MAADLGIVGRVDVLRRWPAAIAGRLQRSLASLSAVALLVVGWEAIAYIWEPPFFPRFSAVVARLIELIGEGAILVPLFGSIRNLLVGFTIAVIVGLTTGLLMGSYPRVEAALDIYVYGMFTAPSLVFAPILFSIFGLGPQPVIGLIIMYAVFIIIINTAGAVRAVPDQLVRVARSFGANDYQVFKRIVLPSAAPMIFAGVRVAGARAVKGMINGEMFIAAIGLGALVRRAGNRFDPETVLAVLLVIVAVAFLFVRLISIIDRQFTSWLPDTRRRVS